MSLVSGPTADAEQTGARSGATLFVSDPTAEAEQVAGALRSAGYMVVDVPLSMLVARAAVQHPHVILVDADSHGAVDVVCRIRELPQGEDIHVLFVAAPGGAVTSLEDALAHEGSGFFMRPVDLPALLKEVETLTGGIPPRRSAPPPSPSTHPPRSRPPSVPPSEGLGSPSLPPTSIAWAAASRAVGLGPPVSTDLQRLLAEAEQRAHVAADETGPSPEQEVESVLPSELLAALDEPLEDDDREAENAGPTRPPSRSPRERTNDGGPSRTTGASTTGSGAGITGPGTGEDVRVTPGPSARTEKPDEALEAELPREPIRVVAHAIAARKSCSLCFASSAERRLVFREGDVVTCASTADDESLLAFLGVRGELPRETVRRLASRFPPFGKHAAAALVARGYLRQDQMWTTLRAHAEWVFARTLQASEARVVVEDQPPGRLASEPSVFGGATGAEVFVEVVRRVVSPTEAVERLGGESARLGEGRAPQLLPECGLAPAELELLRASFGRTVRDVLNSTADRDFAAVIFAITELGVLNIVPTLASLRDDVEAPADEAALDADAVRARIRARLQLVEDGDYFSILGVSRDATGYEVRRAFLELRRAFDPARLLSPDVADLANDVRIVTSVLEEAYDILKDTARRERYRRAIEGSPQG